MEGANAAPDGVQTVQYDPHNMEFGLPDGTTPVDGATRRVAHQYFSYNAATDTFGPGSQGSFIPQKFYELEMKEDFIQLHPDLAAKTRFFCFHDDKGNARVPGPLIRAKYGEPVLVRFKNKLPSVKTPQDFGIAEMTTHLHNGHTPSESDGNPVNFFNSINDPNRGQPERASRISTTRTCMPASGIRRSARRATRTRRWVRCGTTITTSISPPRTSTRACSAATICSTISTPACPAPG